MFLSNVPVHSTRGWTPALEPGNIGIWIDEISTLTEGGRKPFLTRLWSDSFDEGCFFESHVTKKREAFYLFETERDKDYDVICWVLKAVNTNLDCTVKVYND